MPRVFCAQQIRCTQEGLWAHPGDLAVHVRVGVDPARGDQASAGVELLVSRDVQAPRARAIADGDDQAVLDGHVGDALLAARAVHQRAAADDEVRHPATSLPVRGRRPEERHDEVGALRYSAMLLLRLSTKRNAWRLVEG